MQGLHQYHEKAVILSETAFQVLASFTHLLPNSVSVKYLRQLCSGCCDHQLGQHLPSYLLLLPAQACAQVRGCQAARCMADCTNGVHVLLRGLTSTLALAP